MAATGGTGEVSLPGSGGIGSLARLTGVFVSSLLEVPFGGAPGDLPDTLRRRWRPGLQKVHELVELNGFILFLGDLDRRHLLDTLSVHLAHVSVPQSIGVVHVLGKRKRVSLNNLAEARYTSHCTNLLLDVCILGFSINKKSRHDVHSASIESTWCLLIIDQTRILIEHSGGLNVEITGPL